jgi:hypothetical protein
MPCDADAEAKCSVDWCQVALGSIAGTIERAPPSMARSVIGLVSLIHVHSVERIEAVASLS